MCTNNRTKNATEVADIFRVHIDSYRKQHKLSAGQWKVVNAICNCRTRALGGHVQKCDGCGVLIISYDSCRNRHCPKCQSMAKARWIEARKKELLPVEYFHTVFTIPHEFNVIAGYNPTIVYNILFKAAWETVSKLGKDKRRLGGEMGMLATLHTWSQSLLQHIHLHCIIPGGAFNEEEEWLSCKPGFLFPVQALSRIFRGTFVSLLRKAYENNELVLKGAIAHLVDENAFTDLLNQLMEKEWCVYSKKPFDGANSALEYLGRYTYKIAISNNRILSCNNGKVRFKWRDYADDNKIKVMTLDVHEFIRRFLMHVLPNGFMRIRSFGFWANSCKAKKLPKILNALRHTKMEKPADQAESAAEFIQRLTGIDVTSCPKCKVGKLHNVDVLPNFRRIRQNAYWDTS